MSDSNLTIGASFDKAQLDAALAEGQTAVRKLPDTFNLAFSEASKANQRAWRQISDDTKAGAANVSASFRSLATATVEHKAALRDVAAATRIATDGSVDHAQALSLLAAAQERAAATSAELAAAQQSQSVASMLDAGATDAAATANERMQYAMAYGTARIASYAGGVGSLGYALGSVLGRMESVAPLLATAFEIAAPIAFLAIVGEIASKVKDWYDNTVLLKKQLSDLLSLDQQTSAEKGHSAFDNIKQQIEEMRSGGDLGGAAQLLQQHIGEMPIKLDLKISQKDLDALDRVTPGIRSLVNELQSPDLTLAQAQEHLGEINTQILQLQQRGLDFISPEELERIDRAKQSLDNVFATIQNKQQNAEGQVEQGFDAMVKHQAETIKGAAKKREQEELDSSRKLEEIRAQGFAAARREEAQFDADQSRGLAGQTQAFIDANNKQIEAGKQAVEQLRKITLDGNRGQIEAAQALGLGQVALAQDRTKHLADLGLISTAQRVQEQQQQEDKLYAIKLKAMQQMEQLLETVYADDPQNPERVQQLAQLHQQEIALLQKHELDKQKIAESGDVKASKTPFGQVLERSVQSIGTGFDSMVRGVLEGTQSISQAWHRMAADMLASWASSMIQMEGKHLAAELAIRFQHLLTGSTMAAQDAATAAAKQATQSTQGVAEVTSNAAVAASATFASIAAIPIVGPELAPAAAAASFATVMGFAPLASAEGGQWRVPINEQLTMLHRNEMVLPAQHAEGLRRMVDGGGGGTNLNATFNVNANDSRSFAAMLQGPEVKRALVQLMQQAMRERAFQ